MPSTVISRIDGLTTSAAVKPPIRIMTSAPVTLYGEQVINAVTPDGTPVAHTAMDGDRIGVNGQANKKDNGIYVCRTTAWERAKDFDGALDTVFGTLVIDSIPLIWRLITPSPVLFGNSDIEFTTEEGFNQGNMSRLLNHLDTDEGAALVGRALRHINDVDELRSVAGRYDGDMVRLTSYYDGWAAEAVPAPRGGGIMVWDAASTVADDGVLTFQVAAVATGRWVRPVDHILQADDAGIVHEASPTTNQTARVQAFLNACEGRPICLGRAMTVGIAGPVQPKSNTTLLANGLNLFALPSFVGTPVIGFMVEFKSCVNTLISRMRLNGNALVIAGGLSPVVAGDYPRGFGVLESCDRVTLDGCYAFNVWGNGFICFNGGVGTPLSTNIRFKDCVAEASGIGMGQEIRNPDTAGPGPVIYENCRVILCNYGLYIAGGNAHLIGGDFHSKRLQAFVAYTGDSHTQTRISGTNPKFRITPETGSNQVALIHCIDKAASSPSFDLQEFLVVELDAPEFVCDHTGTSVQIETGCNVTLNKPVFKGGGTQLRGSATTSTGGPYKNGSIVINDPEFVGWANNADSVIPGIPMTLNNPRWTEPVGPNSGCLRFTATGQRATVAAPRFGATGSAVQPQNGISSSVSGTTLICRDAQDLGLTGTMFNVSLANAGAWLVENATPGTSIIVKQHLGSATYDPPSLADGAGVTTTVTVTGANVGDFAEAAFSNPLQGITVTAWVSAANTVSVRFQNESGGVLDLASGTLWARSVRPV